MDRLTRRGVMGLGAAEVKSSSHPVKKETQIFQEVGDMGNLCLGKSWDTYPDWRFQRFGQLGASN